MKRSQHSPWTLWTSAFTGLASLFLLACTGPETSDPQAGSVITGNKKPARIYVYPLQRPDSLVDSTQSIDGRFELSPRPGQWSVWAEDENQQVAWIPEWDGKSPLKIELQSPQILRLEIADSALIAAPGRKAQGKTLELLLPSNLSPNSPLPLIIRQDSSKRSLGISQEGLEIRILGDSSSLGLKVQKTIDPSSLISSSSSTTSMSSALQLGTFVDPRDNEIYPTVKIGSQTWMTQNLRHRPSAGAWRCPFDAAKCNIFGIYYDYNTALSICPVGSKLPDSSDYAQVLGIYGPSKAPDLRGEIEYWNLTKDLATNRSGFAAVPGGWGFGSGDIVTGDEVYLWSASLHTIAQKPLLLHNSTSIDYFQLVTGQPENMHPVRCLVEP
jgi:uncharacterized protein (TIGR02145 family)